MAKDLDEVTKATIENRIQPLLCHAIVVGINEYENNRKLKNAVADAEAIAAELSKLHFDITPLFNANCDEFDIAIDNLWDKCYDVVVVYFAGHGMMYTNEDYIVFADAAPMGKAEGTPATRKSRKIEKIYKDIRKYLPDAMVIAIIDACRQDFGELPEEEEADRGSLVNNFEIRAKIPFQTFIAFATSPADTTGDGVNGHSKYTQALLEEISVENQPIETTFKNVRRKVYKGHGDHLPWEHSCLVNDFAFNHGQCRPHFYSPYYPDGFGYPLSSPEYLKISEIAKAIIKDYLRTGNHGLFHPLMNRDLSLPTDLFLLGRAIMHYILEAKSLPVKFLHKDFIKPFCADGSADVLNGFIYELYFTHTDTPRRSVEHPQIYQHIHDLFSQNEFPQTLKFITTEIQPQFCTEKYLPGSNTVAKFRMALDDTGYMTPGGETLFSLEYLTYNGKHLDFFQETDIAVLSYKKFRNELLRLSMSPGILLSLNVDLDYIEPYDYIMRGELSEAAVAEALEDYFASSGHGSLDELGHHYEWVCVEFVDIEEAEVYHDDMTVTGSLTISTIVYLDNEEEIREDVSLTGSFRIDYFLTPAWRDIVVKFDTSDFFKKRSK